MIRLFKHTFLLLVIIGLLNWVGTYLYLYWTIWWFDMLMHFISGLEVGMAAVLIWQYFYPTKIRLTKKMAIGVLGGLTVGLLWEAYELYFGITTLSDGVAYYTDTVSDLILDLCGGFFAGLYANKILK
jgi:hypothetical protein